LRQLSKLKCKHKELRSRRPKKRRDSEDTDDDGQPDGKKSSRKKDGMKEKTFERKEKSPEGQK
jgi:hypothetical protein